MNAQIYIYRGSFTKMTRLCDLAAISDPGHPDLQETTTRLQLRQVSLSPRADWLRQGRYKFKVIIAANNCTPKAYWIDLELTGIWDNEPSGMISNGVLLKVRED